MSTQDNNQQEQQNQQQQNQQQQQYQQPYQQQPYQQQPYQQQPYQQQPYQQQPYQQQPQQYQQQQYQQQPQQPYYPQQPQQPVYVVPQQAPAQPQPQPASPEAKEAAFSAASSIFMLILCIVGSVKLIPTLIGDIMSVNIKGLLLYVLDILILVGMWVTFANAKKQKLSAKGIKLIKVPYIIQFVFYVLSFAVNLVVWFFSLRIISLVIGIITFVITCITFASVKKTLKLAQDINNDKSVVGRKASKAAAVIMIISAAFTLIGDIIDYVMIEAIKESIGSKLPKFILSLIGGGGVAALISAIVTFFVGILGAIVILQFAKKVKAANEVAPQVEPLQ